MDGFDYDVVVQHNGLPLRRENPDDSLIVVFSVVPVKNEVRTEQVGCPQYDEKETIKILAPGEKNPLYEGSVRDKDKIRFAAKYQAWKQNKEPSVSGFPIEQWPLLSVGQVAELKACSVFTVENICDIPDSRLNVLGLHGRKLRDQAKDFFAKAKGEAPLLQIRAENEKLSARVATLEKQNIELLNHLQTAARGDPNLQITAPVPVQAAVLGPDLSQMVAQAVAAAMAANQPVQVKKKGGRPRKVITETTSEESN